MKNNYISSLSQLLIELGLLPNKNQVAANPHLLQACRWALNAPNYNLSVYKPVALKAILGTLKKESTTMFTPARSLTLEMEENGKGLLMPNAKPTPLLVESQLKKLKTVLKTTPEDLLLTILEREGSTMAVNELYEDISLYDFIKTAVGIAECLRTGNGKMRLMGGSISGIQSYLYDIVSKNAAKLLKGRSFYVQLLCDSLLEKSLKQFDLSPCHVVYSSGGGFYILVPDSDALIIDFESFRKKITEKIYAEHGTMLFVELAITKTFDAQATKINEIWDELFTNLGSLKYQRLNQNEPFLKDFFGFMEAGGFKSEDRDPITNEEFKHNDEKEPLYTGETALVKRSTKDQIELGKDLRQADYWVKATTPFLGKERRTLKDPFGTCHYLLKEAEFQKIKYNLKPEHDVIVLNKTDKPYPFMFYGGNDFPFDADTGYAKTFDKFAENDGLKRLAILRMDVDGLGAIFSGDIASKGYDLNWVRYVSVSRSLDYFFKGFLNQLQKPYKETTVIIYSGGDDLFIVGKWDAILKLSQEIQLQFKSWSCSNLTLSGGAALLPSKFPVMQGARLADEVEKKAKNHSVTLSNNILKKNTITILNMPLNWDKEFPLVLRLKKEIADLLKTGFLEKSFVSKVNAHAEAQRAYLEKKVTSPRWMWVMAYDFARFGERSNKVSASFIKEMQLASVSNQYKGNKIESNHPFLQILQLAVRWAELEYRSN